MISKPMDKDKAILVLSRMVENLEQSASHGEELDWALEQSGFWRGDLKEAIAYLKGVSE
jgi:hypothetical protein